MRLQAGAGAKKTVDPAAAPARVVLAQGARGELVRQVQAVLAAAGHYKDVLDGDYGDGTAKAVDGFRRNAGLGAGRIVDTATWAALLQRPLPDVRERALAVTAAFEGHGFGLVAGNYDGAGITWGIIGFTLASGNVAALVLEAEKQAPGCLERAFAAKARELVRVLAAPRATQLAWADAISAGARKTSVREPWRSGFRRLGELPEVQALQLDRVDAAYFQPARRTAHDLGLRTELGLALCFDVHVQNGGVAAKTRDRIRGELAAQPIHKERELRTIVANAVADASRAEYREDVRSRKLTLATGAGKVHGATYVLRNWGLDSSPLDPRG